MVSRARLDKDVRLVDLSICRWHFATMAKSIKISDEEMDLVREEAALSSRSIGAQVMHWARIGRSIERSRFFTYARVRRALSGRLDPDALTAEEQEVYVDELIDIASAPTSEQDAFFAQRRRRGLGVGKDERGRIVRADTTGN